MSRLEEIEAAAEALTPDEKQELMLFLAARMRGHGHGLQMPEPRRFSFDQLKNWIAEDEADMRRFEQGK